MMRNFCWKLINDYEIDPIEVKVIGFVISGMYIHIINKLIASSKLN